MSKINRMVLFLFALVTTLAGTAQAGDAGTKLGRGFENIITSPVELLVQHYVAGEKGPVAAIVKGTLYGVGMMVVRIVGGAYEIVTFPIPAPANYAPLLDPATPLKALRQLER